MLTLWLELFLDVVRWRPASVCGLAFWMICQRIFWQTAGI
jgi:hypothetical protein